MPVLSFSTDNFDALLAELNAAREFNPSYDDCVAENIPTPPKFWLVGNEGVYLMSNARGLTRETRTVTFAKGCNPEFDEDWRQNKRALFGGNDGVVPFPKEWLNMVVEAKAPEMRLKLSEGSVELLV